MIRVRAHPQRSCPCPPSTVVLHLVVARIGAHQQRLCMPGRKAQHPKVGGVLGGHVVAGHPGPGVCSFPQLQAALQLRPVRLCRPGQDTWDQGLGATLQPWWRWEVQRERQQHVLAAARSSLLGDRHIAAIVDCKTPGHCVTAPYLQCCLAMHPTAHLSCSCTWAHL